MKITKIAPKKSKVMDDLLLLAEAKSIPKTGDLVESTVLSVAKNEVYVDIDGLTTGVVRGKEIYDESGEYSEVKVGDRVTATVLEMENENGEMELSFRFAGHQKAWNNLENLLKTQAVTPAKVIDANKGGLMVKLGNVIGFLPVSQLSIENYPRVEGGDKTKILSALRKFIGMPLKVKVIDINEQEEKLIVSEKAAWDEKQQKTLARYKIGDVVEGKITGVTNFGAFVEFGESEDALEGLIHISELAWQRIDDPKQIVKVGDKVKAAIIDVQEGRISLSMKKLTDDPWKNVTEKYKVSQKVQGKVLKLNPFGAFVELDKDIHGLIHISELSGKDHKVELKEGETNDFYIISLEPAEHRLGLSLKKPKDREEKPEEPKTEEKASASALRASADKENKE
ncbi:MAG: hypothetical protein A2927_01500 [Candidatus Komeilibacteria bacterium RIFCSPLOWO2_01_FULL_45_10]|uniref:S1 motif domain-containing protein n=1 Tax=Candidatus Komeilibacteria bacterium RIFCSPLOWO2_01_FULL_45_10 TaxID=1798550 RepID=A0A1G2BKP5_9BACT|nr:MAG: hypothetical protein A2927_01500 [Candidatus Komeilibacteria bacterium RIFCSPLOWO2_01_FULL_45_10]